MTIHRITGTHTEVMAEVSRITEQAVEDGYGYSFRPEQVAPGEWAVTVEVFDAPRPDMNQYHEEL